MQRFGTAALAGLFGLGLALGCAKPGPSQQALATADFAVQQAREQGADQGASALMRSAEEKLSRARSLQRKGGKKEYAEAKRLAEQVAVEAQLADALTRNNIAKAHLADAEKVLEELRIEAERRRRY